MNVYELFNFFSLGSISNYGILQYMCDALSAGKKEKITSTDSLSYFQTLTSRQLSKLTKINLFLQPHIISLPL